MSNWNANHYMKYGNERTRAAADLAARVELDSPNRIVDLGCGPGNSTQVLRSRWPNADVCGVDNSPQMIETARETYPTQQWILGDLSDWSADKPFDLVYSNAAFPWIPDHQSLMSHLLTLVADGGALAFQIPSSTYATVRTHIHEISHDAVWNDRMEGPRTRLTMQPPAFYYDALVGNVEKLDIWETEYNHIMENSAAIVDWISSTGLRPFLDVLNDDEKKAFVDELQQRVADSYPTRADGKVLYPFRRLFVIAYR